MKLRDAFAEAMIDGWLGEWAMWRVVNHAFLLANTDDDHCLEKIKTVNGGRYVPGDMPARTWIANNFRNLNESLWAGRKREAQIICARKELGGNLRGVAVAISARAADKRHDWATCK